MTKYRGRLVEWAATHGVIETDDGRRVYANATEFTRAIVPEVGARVRFEIVEDAADADQMPSAQNVVMVVK